MRMNLLLFYPFHCSPSASCYSLPWWVVRVGTVARRTISGCHRQTMEFSINSPSICCSRYWHLWLKCIFCSCLRAKLVFSFAEFIFICPGANRTPSGSIVWACEESPLQRIIRFVFRPWRPPVGFFVPEEAMPAGTGGRTLLGAIVANYCGRGTWRQPGCCYCFHVSTPLVVWFSEKITAGRSVGSSEKRSWSIDHGGGCDGHSNLGSWIEFSPWSFESM